jgi:hypothetical protein
MINSAWLLFFLMMPLIGWTQIKLKRNSNPTLQMYSKSHSNWNSNTKLKKWGKNDTLKIPFFDDFVSTKIYPDSTKWFNNYVFINNDFPLNPPSYGVATFDDLDAKGNPYQELNINNFGACDTLLSLAINLKDSSGRLYTPSDSIYFSFFYQRQGLGDASDNRDSIILQFKDISGKFNTVFKATGGNVEPFKIVMIKIISSAYLHKGFQFRFINFSRHTGNTNQWHIDYVHLSRNRRRALNYYDDFAIQSRPTSLLNNYFSMPYGHFLVDSANQKSKLIFINAYNLHNANKNIQARHIETHNGNQLTQTDFNANNANLLAFKNAERQFAGFNLNNLTGSPVVIKRDYELRESGIGSKNVPNDKMTVYQIFDSYYAQDDGSAEMGFGFDDDEFHPEFQGAIAYKFNLTKADSLWAIGMFFNKSVTSSQNITFNLKVWQKISPLGKGRSEDVNLLTINDLTPKFTDSINGYHVFVLDSAILLPKGDFFIGWEQEGNKHLDVGFDINNGYHPSHQSGKNLFFTLLGSWAEVNLNGALMMRPYVGKKVPLGSSKIKTITQNEVIAYPNPFTNELLIKNNEPLKSITVYDNSGKIIKQTLEMSLDMQTVQPGLYFLEIVKNSGEIIRQKLVKLHY